MSERSTSLAVRGTRIGGANSFESASAETALAPRRKHTYTCTFGHTTTLVFHAKAEAPPTWQCAVCPETARHESLAGTDPVTDVALGSTVVKAPKTHWDQLRERRTEAELEALLAEALNNYRTTGKAF